MPRGETAATPSIRCVSPLALCALLLTGCALTGRTTPAQLPAQANFEPMELRIPGTGRVYPVWRTHSPGTPVLLLHAVNGLSSECLQFALEMEDWGYRVYSPSLYGDPVDGRPAYGFDRTFDAIGVVWQSGLWNPVSPDSPGSILDDVFAMARWVSAREGGREIAVIGNSFTGAFPLALLAEEKVRVAVLGQPALPAKRVLQILLRLPQSPERERSLALSERHWQETMRALRSDPNKRIFGFHYSPDPVAPIQRFDELHRRLARQGLENRFVAYVLTGRDDSYAWGRADWVETAETSRRLKMLTPHSTYLDAEHEEDRAWFREKLRWALDRSF